jgi:hypothetical protein
MLSLSVEESNREFPDRSAVGGWNIVIGALWKMAEKLFLEGPRVTPSGLSGAWQTHAFT